MKLYVILGNMLFEDISSLGIRPGDKVFMAEDFGLCTHFKFHKHKIIFFLSAMRAFRDKHQDNYDILYHELERKNKDMSYEDKLQKVIEDHNISQLITYSIEDTFFRKRLERFSTKHNVSLAQVDSPGFLTKQEDFKGFLGQQVATMQGFYQFQRRRLKVLIDTDGKPTGGRWSFDEMNRLKLPKGLDVPPIPTYRNPYQEEVSNLVDDMFNNHPGSCEHFFLPVTHKDAKQWLGVFLKDRFQNFGPYEDAITSDTLLFHSLLSPMLNSGLITPQFVLDETLKYAQKNSIAINSLEGFVRQLIGWREYVRGHYHNFDYKKPNHFKFTRTLSSYWYTGDTGIPILDDSIKKVVKYGYTHHIERLMVIGNIMLMCRIDPQEVYKWFMEMYVDSLDWVMAPNVFGMSQYADGGVFATKPYISGSNYLRKMSRYPKGEWYDIVDGLYWMFVRDYRPVFEKNARMAMMIKHLDKMDEERKKSIFTQAQKFIDKVTE